MASKVNLASRGKGRRYVDNTESESGSKDTSAEGADSTIIVHHVPFKVEYEGQANVDIKFTAKSVPLKADSKVLCNQFRGRPLQGQVLTLPKEYEGLVATDLRKSHGNSEDGDDETTEERTEISLTKRFDELTYWNWDRVPSGMDKHIKLMDWLEISQILHAPIDDA